MEHQNEHQTWQNERHAAWERSDGKKNERHAAWERSGETQNERHAACERSAKTQNDRHAAWERFRSLDGPDGSPKKGPPKTVQTI